MCRLCLPLKVCLVLAEHVSQCVCVSAAEVRKTAGGQQGEEEEEEEEGQWAEEALGMGRGRPSEWAGFIYNPYSGDLLPQV